MQVISTRVLKCKHYTTNIYEIFKRIVNILYYDIYENLHKEYLQELCIMNISIYKNFDLRRE